MFGDGCLLIGCAGDATGKKEAFLLYLSLIQSAQSFIHRLARD